MLTHRVPYPPNRGDRVRSYHLLRHLASRFDVWLACTSDEPVDDDQRRELGRLTSDLAIRPISPTVGTLRGLASLALGGPVTPAYFHRGDLARRVVDWHRRHRFQAMLTFCTGMIGLARAVVRADRRLPGGGRLRHVLDLVDVDSCKWDAYASSSRPPMRQVYEAEARRLRRIEAGRLDDVDAVTIISRPEAELYRRAVGDHPGLTVVRNGVDLDYFRPMRDAGTRTAVFIGVMDYRPNVEGLLWFAREVIPRLPEGIPFRLRVVGQRPAPEVLALADHPAIEVVGAVPDVRDDLASASVVIAPLHIAQGIQNKVLEGMASARAVLCTPGAATGIEAEPGRHLVVESSPEGWARSLCRLLDDREHRSRIAAEARRQVEALYDWEVCLEPMGRLLLGT
ncbi:TIGR03087 family PEP-CTERM/XrtA system glycosyltransferase [Tautonia sociabilis]|nr:TIGR03087 family PEP-CTERM/XrtA system glycosyltransferase [Tautonia sociabilis]